MTFKPNIGSYEDKYLNFNWHMAEKELGYRNGDILNIGWYCTDRICHMGKSDKTALIWEGNAGKSKRYTFNDLRILSNTVGNFLKNLDIKEKDRVCLFLDRIPELYFSFIGILKIGAIVQPLFSAFGEESLYLRLNDAQTRVVITQRKFLHKLRSIKDNLPHLEFIIVVDPIQNIQEFPDTIHFNIERETPIHNLNIFPSTPESPSVLHYTSGTTGQPKGVKHVHYSVVSQYITAKWVLDLKDNDIYWCTADPGWVTGTSYGIIGPWSMGITQCILDTGFKAETWLGFIERNRITVWYTAPTAIRSMMRTNINSIRKFNLSCLRHLASVGEPLNPEAVLWSEKVFGKAFHDTYWQTETGSIMVANFPGLKIKAGSMGKPFPGIRGAILDPNTLETIDEPGKPGLLAFRPGWPAMMRTYWNNDETYQEKFANGWYITGDKARTDHQGYFWFIGRDDDIINTGGHLVSPFEVESALLEYPSVVESAVVSKPDHLNFEVVKAYIVLKDNSISDDDQKLKIMNFIRKKLSPMAMPQEIDFVERLPKTRSGKIMRRILHAKEWGIETGDTSSLEDIE